MRITFARRSGPTLMWSLFLGCAHNKVRSWFYPFDLTWLLQCRAVPADHGVRDVREAFDPLEGAEDETILLLQLLQRWRLGSGSLLVLTSILLRWWWGWRDVDIEGLEQVCLRGCQGHGVPRLQGSHSQVPIPMLYISFSSESFEYPLHYDQTQGPCSKKYPGWSQQEHQDIRFWPL